MEPGVYESHTMMEDRKVSGHEGGNSMAVQLAPLCLLTHDLAKSRVSPSVPPGMVGSAEASNG